VVHRVMTMVRDTVSHNCDCFSVSLASRMSRVSRQRMWPGGEGVSLDLEAGSVTNKRIFLL
jgi:hypothetical protein